MNERENEEITYSKQIINFNTQRICPKCIKFLDINSKICDSCNADLKNIRAIGESDEILKQIAVSALNDPDPKIRKEAIDSLGDFEELQVLGLLGYVLLNDPDEKVRKEAADELGDISHIYSIQILIQALKDPNLGVIKEAYEGLEKIVKAAETNKLEINIEDIKLAMGQAELRFESQKDKRTVKKTQTQMMQEALGLAPQDIQEIEKKLFIARFCDYFSEECLDFIFKDRFIDQNVTEILKALDMLSSSKNEEDKLLKTSFNNKGILKLIDTLKGKAEALAASQGITNSMDARMRKLSLYMTIPMIAMLALIWIIPPEFSFFFFPLLCIFCMAPQILRGSMIKKWYQFKEQNKNQFYSENREDLLVLKSFTGEVLNNIRSRLLDLKVPLQLIRFVLHSNDYENLKLITQRAVRGSNAIQYFFSFEYPAGVEPFPIPESLRQGVPDGILPEAAVSQKSEQNFIVLADLDAKEGVIKKFVPTLKSSQANKINEILNSCEFIESKVEFSKIVPEYSADNGIYCLCGDLVEIKNVQLCNWKDQFKFYLFESKKCECGEKIYALSLINDDDKVPDELKDIFLD